MKRRQFIMSAAGIPFYLPLMEGLLSPEEARAQDAGVPKSFMITLRNGCGRSKKFWQADNGAITAAKNAGLSCAPLGDYASKLLFVNRLQHSVSGNSTGSCSHGITSSLLLTGGDYNTSGGFGGETATEQSLDYYAHKAFGFSGEPLYIQVGLLNGKTARVSWAKNNQEVTRVTNPYITWTKLFTTPPTKGGNNTAPVTGPDPALTLRKGVLDSILVEINQLKSNPRLSADDRIRLDQHLSAVKAYEDKLKVLLAQNPGMGGSTKVGPSDRLVDDLNARNGKNGNDWGNQKLITELHMESIAIALANGNTRVATISMGVSIDMIGYSIGNYSNDFHNTSHIDEFKVGSNDQRYAQLDAHDKFFAERFKFLLDKINELPVSGGGSYLDHGVSMWLCDMGPHAQEWSAGDGGKGHAQNNLMQVVAGGGKLGLKQGQKIDLNNEVNNRFLATIGNAIGLQNQSGGGAMTSFNADAGLRAARNRGSGSASKSFTGILTQMKA